MTVMEVLTIISPLILFVLGYILNGLNNTIKELTLTIKEIQKEIKETNNKTIVLEGRTQVLSEKMNRCDSEFEKIEVRQTKQDEMINALRMAHNTCQHKRITV